MQVVYIPGVWDLLHVGHVTILERAKALGDRLVVGVAADCVVEMDKGKRPIIPLADRVRMLCALRCVDAALPYYVFDFVGHLEMVQPDILVVGETWGSEERHTRAQIWVCENERRLIQLPYYRRESTTDIKRRIRQ